MPRVPSTELSIGIASARTPFQNVRPADTSGTGRALQQAGRGLQRASGALADYAEEEDRRTLLEIEQEEQALANDLILNPETGLQSKSGQMRLDAIRGERAQPGDPGGAGGVMDVYDQRAAKIIEKRKRLHTEEARKTADLYGKSSRAALESRVHKLALEARNEADTNLITSRLAHIQETALGAVGTPGQEVSLANAERRIADSIKDPIMGLAKLKGITDKAQIEQLVKAQTGALYDAAIRQLAAEGKAIDAKKLLDSQLADGGSLRGTPEGTKLLTAVKKMSDLQQATDQFEGMLTRYGTTNYSAIYAQILKVEDANLQAGMEARLRSHMSFQGGLQKSVLAKETAVFVAHISQHGSIEGLDLSTISNFMTQNPEVIADWSIGGPKAIAAAGQLANREATTAHVAAGGSAVGSRPMHSYLKTLAKNEPQEFIDLIGGSPKTVQSLLNVNQWDEISALYETAQADVEGFAQGKGFTMQADAVQQAFASMGIRDDRKETNDLYDRLMRSSALRRAIQQARLNYYKEHGQAIPAEHLQPLIARFTLEVTDSAGEDHKMWEVEKLAELGQKVDDLALDVFKGLVGYRWAHSDDARRLQFIFPEANLERIEDAVENVEGEVTINSISQQLGIPPRPMIFATQERTAVEDIAISNGLPPDFVLWSLNETRAVVTAQSAAEFVEDFLKAGAASKRETLALWTSSRAGN